MSEGNPNIAHRATHFQNGLHLNISRLQEREKRNICILKATTLAGFCFYFVSRSSSYNCRCPQSLLSAERQTQCVASLPQTLPITLLFQTGPSAPPHWVESHLVNICTMSGVAAVLTGSGKDWSTCVPSNGSSPPLAQLQLLAPAQTLCLPDRVRLPAASPASAWQRSLGSMCCLRIIPSFMPHLKDQCLWDS